MTNGKLVAPLSVSTMRTAMLPSWVALSLGSRRSQFLVLASLLIAQLPVVACEGKQPVQGARPSAAIAGPGDSLAKLMKAVLGSEDPVAALNAFGCEYDRLIELYGPAQAEAIRKQVDDTIFSPKERRELRRLDKVLAYHVSSLNCPHWTDSARQR
jgi:hypothetical protein